MLRTIFTNLCISAIFLTISCSNSSNKDKALAKNQKTYSGHYKIGKPYIIENIKYHPKKDDSYKEIGIASWYGSEDGFHGKKTANGDLYNKQALTAAHRTLPLPSIVRVTNLKNNHSVILMVNDRGPFSKKKLIDVSEKAAELLKMKHQGSTKVEVEYLKDETKKLLKHIALTEKEGAYADKKTSQSPASFLEAQNNKFLYNSASHKAIKFSNRLLTENKIISSLGLKKASNKKYYVQVGSYKSKHNAEKIGRELNKFGKPTIKSLSSIYQVSFGPFKAFEGKELIEHLVDIGNENLQIIANN